MLVDLVLIVDFVFFHFVYPKKHIPSTFEYTNNCMS